MRLEHPQHRHIQRKRRRFGWHKTRSCLRKPHFFRLHPSDNMLVFMCMVFVLFAPEVGAVKPASVPSDCMPFNYTMCKDILPYNLTRLPNYLKHHTTDAIAAALDNKEISILIQTNCSTDLAFFLCVLHFPICVQGFRGPVLPCRNLCNKVRQECTPTITRYGKKWPEEIHCGNFPVYEKGVCMKRISVHNSKYSTFLNIINGN